MANAALASVSTIAVAVVCQAQTGSLAVRLFGETGGEIHEGEIKISALNRPDGDKVAGWSLEPAESATLPHGDYRVEAFVAGFYVERGVVRVAQPVLTSRLVLRLGIAPCVTHRVVGKVEPTSAEHRDLWVKLVALGRETHAGVHQVTFVTDVTSSGEFELTGMNDGAYLLLLLASEPEGLQRFPRVVKSQSVDVKSGVVNVKFEIDD